MSRINDIWQRKPAGLVLGMDFSGERITSPTGHSGTLVGNAAVAAGTRYLACDGVGDYLSVADAPEFTFNSAGQDLPFSVMCWFKATTLPAANIPLLTKASSATTFEWVFRVNGGGFPQFVALNTTATAYRGRRCNATGTYFTTGIWYHMAGTYSGNEANSGFRVFIGAVQSDTADASTGTYTGMTDTTSPVAVGGALAGSESFNGAIADVRIYNRELTQPEIAQIYNAGAARIALGGTP